MKQCGCREALNEKLNEVLKCEGGQINYEMFSGKTFSTFNYETTERGKKRKKETMVLHTYCPSCGEKYKRDVEQG
jgi:hypothetical protein